MQIARTVVLFASVLAFTAGHGLSADWPPDSYLVEVLVDSGGGSDACLSGQSAALFEFWTHPSGSDDDLLTTGTPVDSSRNGLGCDTVGKLHAKGSTLCSRVINAPPYAGRIKGTVDACGLRFELHGFDADVQSTKACCDRKDPRNTRSCTVVEWERNCPNGDDMVLGRGTDCGDCNPMAAFGTEVEEPDIRGCCGIATGCVSLDATSCAVSGGRPLGSGCFPGACEPEPKKQEPPPEPLPTVPPPPQLGRCTIIAACPGGDRLLCVNSTEEQCRTTSGAMFDAGGRCEVVQNECPPFSPCDDAAGSYRLDEHELQLDSHQRARVYPTGAPATRVGSWSCVVEGAAAAVTISWSDGGTDTIAIERVGGRKTVRPLSHQDPAPLIPKPLPIPKPPAPAGGGSAEEKRTPRLLTGPCKQHETNGNFLGTSEVGAEGKHCASKVPGGKLGWHGDSHRWVCYEPDGETVALNIDAIVMCKERYGNKLVGVCYNPEPTNDYYLYAPHCVVRP